MDIMLDPVAIGVLAFANFVLGALWFGPIFGKLWMKIHHGDKKPTAAEMTEMTKGMWILMLAEFLATLMMVVTLSFLLEVLPFSGLHIGFLVWIGFVLPMVVSNTLWGNDKKHMMLSKILLSGSYRLVSLLATGYILSIW
jgi:uncharacterized membrane protein YciS (DUF1049 family)